MADNSALREVFTDRHGHGGTDNHDMELDWAVVYCNTLDRDGARPAIVP